jgi:hypothetical protein
MNYLNKSRSNAMKRYWKERREINERRSLSLLEYWNNKKSDKHRAALRRSMKQYWLNYYNN